jgi:DNA invertase Pin-like site-specific DNA recombinase
MSYCIYLRKSREDEELEALGGGDTLQRHRAALLTLAKQKKLNITHIYEEVISGESIASRPEMQSLLSAVEQGAWDGVLCMEVERLARGDTIDQGIVARAFQLSSTKIITPAKTYDLGNEFDDEYFEFGLFMSRREYKTINRRMQRGRLASLNEGKFVGNKTPYGYDRKKLEHEKGWILTPNEEQAPVVQQIFRFYVEDGLTFYSISKRLNELGIPSATGTLWTQCTIRDILRNETYYGAIRWKRRPTEKTVENGVVSVSRPRQQPLIFQGRHEPLVTKELFDAAAKRMAENPTAPGPKGLPMKNPFSGLLYCDQCGKAMVRRTNPKSPTMMICANTFCPTKGSYVPAVEELILISLKKLVGELETESQTKHQSSDVELLKKSIAQNEAALAKLEDQVQRAYDLVETGIYTPQVFVQRSKELNEKIEAAKSNLDDLRQQLEVSHDHADEIRLLCPRIRHVLEIYSDAELPEEKNALLKTVFHRIDYHKLTGGRYQESDLQLVLYPRFLS